MFGGKIKQLILAVNSSIEWLKIIQKVVPPSGIEPPTPPLPMVCSTTELWRLIIQLYNENQNTKLKDIKNIVKKYNLVKV